MSDLVLLTAEQVAAKLGWHVKTVYRNREIPRLEIGGSVRWAESQVDAFLLTKITRKSAPVVTEKTVIRHKLKAVENK